MLGRALDRDLKLGEVSHHTTGQARDVSAVKQRRGRLQPSAVTMLERTVSKCSDGQQTSEGTNELNQLRSVRPKH